MSASDSRRNALVMSIGWWYLRRLIRKRGTAAVTGFLAGEGLSFHEPRKRRRLRWALIEAAMHGPKRTDGIGRWGRRLAVRKGALKARVALARRLCDEIHRGWSELR